MPTDQCPSIDEIRAFLQGDLSAERLEALGEHVNQCPSCDAQAAKLDTEVDAIVAALRSTHRAPVIPDLTSPPVMIGDYQILKEVGRGGMGVVYQARHVTLNRFAAIKMILSGRFAGVEEQLRFRIEGELLARLQHPHIVEVYENGLHDGRPFLVLEWVDGGTLESLLSGPPLPPRRAAELAEQLAEAIQHAHQNGVIHRDLKPANVLLTSDGTLKVTDFGLARAGTVDATGLTVTGTVMGTPAYMAPEQARGHSKTVGPATDVYAIGAILYALLAGRPPFVATSAPELLRAVFEEPAPPLSRFRSRVPRDLNTIVQRCLEKDPARRYASATELVEDLRRWRTNRPIQARPVPFWERGYRFAHRNPVPTIAAALIVMVIAFAFLSIENSRIAEVKSRFQAEAGQLAAQTASVAEAQARRLAEQREALATTNRAILRCEAGELSIGMAELGRAFTTAKTADDKDLMHALRINQSAWSARQAHIVQKFDSPTKSEPIRALEFLHEGQTLVTGGRSNGDVRIWRINGGHPKVLSLPASNIILGARKIFEQSPSSGVRTLFTDSKEKILYVVHADLQIVRWNTATWEIMGPALVSTTKDPFQNAMISPDDRYIAAGTDNGLIHIWSTETGKLIGPDLEHTPVANTGGGARAVTSVGFASPDLLISGGRKEGIKFWDLKTRTVKERIDVGGEVFCMTLSPDRRFLFVGGESTATLWSVDKPTKPLLTFQHPRRVEGLAFSPNGEFLASGDHSGNVWIWERDSGRLYTKFRHTHEIRILRFTPDSQGIVVGGFDGASNLWKLPERPIAAYAKQPNFRVAPAVGFLDGGRIWSVCTTGLIEWQTPPEQMIAEKEPLRTPNTSVWSGAVSRDEKFAITGGWHQDSTQVWNMIDGSPVGDKIRHFDAIWDVGFLPDSRTFYLRHLDRAEGQVRWFRISGNKVIELPSWPKMNDLCAFTPHPDGSRVLVAHHSSAKVTVHAVTSGDEVGPPLKHASAVKAVAVHPNGRLVATGAEDGGIRVWDLLTAEQIGRVGFHDDLVNKIVWGPNDLLASASDDGTARIWDSKTLLPVGPPMRHANAVLAVAFHEPANRLATVARDGSIAVWKIPLTSDERSTE